MKKYFITTDTQKFVDEFYKNNDDCCAGCDSWRFINSIIGECIKSSPVSSTERMGMIDIQSASITPCPGHVITKRDHVCGDFVDSYKWEAV
jgi:hypothetical protein